MSLPESYQVAVPSPLRRLFDYLPPPDHRRALAPGTRVRVPFGSRRLVGVVVGRGACDAGQGRALRAIEQVLDEEPLLPGELLELVRWAADYYHHPVGEAVLSVLPALVRRGESPPPPRHGWWRLSDRGRGLADTAFARAPRRRELVHLLRARPRTAAELRAAGISAAVIRALAAEELIQPCAGDPGSPADVDQLLAEPPPAPHDDQRRALAELELHRYQTYLLYGDTGTGKTEVYLRAIERVLRLGRQALVLVPEIALTPQTLARFESRFTCPVAVLHSGLGEADRARTWAAARAGRVGVLIGTRSAVFTPLQRLGIVIVDEEHDLSYKQQDGFRYSARDVAVMRARRAGIPLLLGSATPSLESLDNARRGRYRMLRLTQRPGAGAPRWELIDLRRAGLREGLSAQALEAIGSTLAAGRQVLVFLNRRGYATALLCHDCAWIGGCPHCDTRLTVHLGAARLICHHCGYRRGIPQQCPDCGGTQLQSSGQGTEKAELGLRELFPDTAVIRIDSDATASRRRLEDKLAAVHSGRPCILVGTQMLAKGHHFPGVALVVVLNADDGLMSPDFRAPERLGQLLTQVAGRTGRGEHPGRVLLQSHFCDHPLLTTLVREGYGTFAARLLDERAALGMPPRGALALVRAEAEVAQRALELLCAARGIAESLSAEVRPLGPLPAPLERRGGRFRYLLSLGAARRGELQPVLAELALRLESLPEARRVRWSIDADPQEML
ncbi:MAG: primosomal protein N' [Pseudomonadota bacterium]|jgi:primosomal protein N' (replication factor Y) (superfamily II helicase)